MHRKFGGADPGQSHMKTRFKTIKQSATFMSDKRTHLTGPTWFKYLVLKDTSTDEYCPPVMSKLPMLSLPPPKRHEKARVVEYKGSEYSPGVKDSPRDAV